MTESEKYKRLLEFVKILASVTPISTRVCVLVREDLQKILKEIGEL